VNERSRILVLVLIMMVVALGATGVALYSLYNAAFHENKDRLRETVQSRARLIEAVARHDRQQAGAGGYQAAHAATLAQVRAAHGRFRGFGETGEFTLARRQGDQIVFLLSHRHRSMSTLKPVPLSSKNAEPMRRALSGRSGTVVGLDYRGETVLAAYEPVGICGWGIVAKIDLEEVREPFLRAGMLAGGFTIVFVIIGSVFFLRIGNPIIRSFERNASRLRAKIMEQQETALALKESRARFMNIFSSNMLGIMFWGADGEISETNDAFLDMVGYTRAEFEAGEVNWRSMTPEEYLAQDEAVLAELARSGIAEPFEKEYFRKDGLRVPIIIGAATDPGEPRAGVCFVMDRTAHRRAEELTLQSLRDKEVLLREIHHRVKNNLQVISSMLNLQRRNLEDPKLVDALTQSRDRIATMALVHETLYKSDDVGTIALGKYIQSIASNLFRSYGVSSDVVVLKVDLGDVELDVNRANPCGMIINELLSNAIIHAFPDGRRGTVQVALSRQGNRIELSVQDDGVGLPPASDDERGAGLGMQLVEAFVDQLHGTLDVHRGEGTRFTVTFDKDVEQVDG